MTLRAAVARQQQTNILLYGIFQKLDVFLHLFCLLHLRCLEENSGSNHPKI